MLFEIHAITRFGLATQISSRLSVVIKVYFDGFSDSSSEFPINPRKEFYFCKS